MMEQMYQELSILINIICSVIAINYIEQGFSRKYKGWIGWILMAIGCLTYFIVLTILNNHMDFESIIGLSYVLVLIIYSFIALKGNIGEKIVMSILWGVIALLCSYVIFGLLRIITELDMESLLKTNGDMRVYSSLAATIMKYSLGRFIVIIIKKIKGLSYGLEERVATGSLFIIFILIIGMFALERELLNPKARYYLSLSLLGGFFGIIICLGYFYRKLETRNQEKQQMEFDHMELKQQVEHFQNLERACREMHTIKHDIKGKMNILYSLIHNGNNKEALKYIEETYEIMDELANYPLDTDNNGLDTALMNALQQSKEKGIQLRYAILAEVSCFNEMDMGILFYNLLTNAVEACSEIEGDKRIDLQIFKCHESLVCNLYNSIKNSVLEKNPELRTSKKDKKAHGYGMKSIYNIIEKYSGEYNCLEENSMFIQEIRIKYPKQKLNI